MKSLYNISKEAIELASQLEEGELTPELQNALSINQNELEEKAINYAYAVKSIESDIDIISEEIARLTALKKAKTSAVDKMKDAVLNAMQIYGIEKVTSPTLSLSVRRSESVIVPMQDFLNPKFLTVKNVYTPDKIAIKKAIESGQKVEGAFIKENYSLQIK